MSGGLPIIPSPGGRRSEVARTDPAVPLGAVGEPQYEPALADGPADGDGGRRPGGGQGHGAGWAAAGGGPGWGESVGPGGGRGAGCGSEEAASGKLADPRT